MIYHYFSFASDGTRLDGEYIVKDYSIFCISEIWANWPGMDLPIYPRSSFGPSEPDLCFGLAWRGLGVALGTPFLWAWRVG